MRHVRLLIACLCITPWAGVSAHTGPVEALSIHPRAQAGADGRIVGTTFGLVTTADSARWEVICSEGIGYDETQEPRIIETPGALFVGSLQGLFVSRDGGCDWEMIAEFSVRGVADLQRRPGAPAESFFVATQKFGAQEAGVYATGDEGLSFTPVFVRADTFFTAIRFAPSQPMRAYVSAWYNTPLSATLLRSDDGGGTFAEVATSLPWVTGFTVLGVSPADPDVLFAMAFDSPDYVLLRSTDGGATFSEVARDAREFRAVAFSADGQVVHAAAQRLFESTDGGETFVKLQSPRRAACVRRFADDAPTVCASTLLDGYALGTLEADGSVTPSLSFKDVRQVSCPAGTSVHDVCEDLWPALALALGAQVDPGDGGPDGGEPEGDGGTPAPDAGGDGGDGDSPAPGCGCSGAGTAGGAWLALPLLGFFAARGRRRPGIAAPLVILGLLAACSAPPPPPPPPPPAASCEPNPCTDPARPLCRIDAGEVVCEPGTPVDACDPNPCMAPNQSVCTIGDDGQAVCGCDPGYIPAEAGCREEPPVSCDAEHDEGDTYEPDECPAQARDIGANGAQYEPHTIAPPGDVDWFRVQVTKDRVIRVIAAGPPTLALRVDAWWGEELERVGQRQSLRDGTDVAFKSPGPGVLYLRLGADDGTATDSYQVSIADDGMDDHADGPVGATPATPGEPVYGAVQFNGDVDVLALPRLPGHALRVSGAVIGRALRFEVMDGEGATVASAEGEAPNLIVRGRDTPLFVRVSDPEGGLGVLWEVHVADLGEDDHGDVPAEATPLTLPANGTANFERSEDVDVFGFDAVPTHVYAVRCTPASAASCYVTVFDPASAIVGSDLDGGAAEVRFEAVTAGRHTFALHTDPGLTGAVTYEVIDLGPDDHGDTPANGTKLGMPPVMGTMSGAGRFELPGDVDVLEFIADVDHIYRFDCAAGTAGSCNVRILNQHGIVLGQDMNGGNGIAYAKLLGGGTFYVELSATPQGVGDYTWEILDLFHDDHGDDIFEATLMSANGALVSGDIQYFGDDDFFRFHATAGHVYRMSCVRFTLGDCLLRFIDGTETVRASDVDGGDAVLLYEIGPAGEYYLHAEGTPSQVGTYAVKIEDLGTDDAPDTAAGARTLVANGTPVNGQIETPGDVDYFQFTASAGGTYAVSGSGTPLVVTVFAPDASTVLVSGGVPQSFTISMAGTHYLEVRALTGTMTGSYSVAVSP